MSFIQEANKHIKNWDWEPKLETAGAGSTTRIATYSKTPEVLKLILALDYEQLPPQAKGLEFEVPGRMKIGGVIVKRPMACTFADGV